MKHSNQRLKIFQKMKVGLLFLSILLSSFTISAKTVFVDAVNGSDTNSGTFASPYKTLQKATDVMVSGDICEIRAGVYRETLIPQADQLTFRSYFDENVLITGLDVVTGWTAYQGNIWQASFTRETPPGAFKASQVFANGIRMNWARYPNQDGNMFSTDDMADMNFNSNGTITAPLLPSSPNNAWVGAYAVGLKGHAHSANKGRIISSTGNTLVATDLTYFWGQGNFAGANSAYLIGALVALDAETEWHLDENTNTLYFYPPAGTDLTNDLIEARARTYGMDLTNRSNITVEGVNFKAAGIKMAGTNCVLDNSTVRYAAAFSSYTFHTYGEYEHGDGGVYMGGTGNTVKNTYIGHSWGNGASMWGSFNTLENCIVEYTNWHAQRMASVSCPGDDNKIIGNTLRYNNNGMIDLGNQGFVFIAKYARRAEIKNNYAHDGGFLNGDQGLFYVNHQGGHNPVADTEVAYNIFDYYGGLNHGGIYLDNHSSGYTIHHNVVANTASGVHINDLSQVNNSHDIYIYNNTMINNAYGVRWNGGGNSPTAHDIVTRNNHCTSGGFAGITVSNNRTNVSLSDFVDPGSDNYRLTSGSASINAGVAIPGITDGAVGAPDLGAYEFGGTDWTAGSTITVPVFEDEAAPTISCGSRIEAEDFNAMSGIQVEATGDVDGVENIGFIDNGDWVSYSNVDLSCGGNVVARVARDIAGSSDIEVRLDGTTGTLIGTISVSNTGGWQTYVTESTAISGASGIHDVYLVFTGGVNVNWIEFTEACGSRIEAEDFDDMLGVEVETTGDVDGNQNIGFISNGDWVKYSNIDLSCGVDGVDVRAASAATGGDIEVRLDGTTGTLIGTITVSNTGGWQTYVTESTSITSVSGVHDVYLVFTGGGGSLMNVNWFEFSTSSTCATFSRIEAESYNNMSGVAITAGTDTDGTSKVSSIHNGDWVVYNNTDLTCATGIDVRTASVRTGNIEVRLGATNGTLIGTVATPNTGNWGAWVTTSINFSSVTGTHDVYLVFTGGSNTLMNFNWIEFTETTCATFSRIEAESYNNMLGVAITAGTDTDGTSKVSSIHNGDWVVYNNVDLSCAASIDVRTASVRTGNIEVRLGATNGTLIGTVATPNTGNWGAWVTTSINFSSVTGTHDVYLVFTGGSNTLMNFNWFEFSTNSAARIATDLSEELAENTGDLSIYPNPVDNILTVFTPDSKYNQYTIFDINGKVHMQGAIPNDITEFNIELGDFVQGIYMLTLRGGDSVSTIKVIKN